VIHYTKIFRPNKKDISIRNLTCSLTTNSINMGKKKTLKKLGINPKRRAHLINEETWTKLEHLVNKHDNCISNKKNPRSEACYWK
jgi:LEA14-like dessication related protein